MLDFEGRATCCLFCLCLNKSRAQKYLCEITILLVHLPSTHSVSLTFIFPPHLPLTIILTPSSSTLRKRVRPERKYPEENNDIIVSNTSWQLIWERIISSGVFPSQVIGKTDERAGAPNNT